MKSPKTKKPVKPIVLKTTKTSEFNKKPLKLWSVKELLSLPLEEPDDINHEDN